MVVEQVTPLLADAVVLTNKQAAIEVVYGQLSLQCSASLADDLCVTVQISSNFWMQKPSTTIFVTSL